MPAEDMGSVTLWIGNLKAGDRAAAQPLWERYFGNLIRLAHAKLRALPRTMSDEEDVALSAFDSFCDATARGRFPQLEDRDDLWRVLVTLTARKAADLREREHRQKRGGGQVRTEADLTVRASEEIGGILAQVAAPEPTPEFAAMMAEEFRRRLDGLRDEGLRRVALLKMEGYSSEEIAERESIARRTVARKLELIRKAWQEEGAP